MFLALVAVEDEEVALDFFVFASVLLFVAVFGVNDDGLLVCAAFFGCVADLVDGFGFRLLDEKKS